MENNMPTDNLIQEFLESDEFISFSASLALNALHSIIDAEEIKITKSKCDNTKQARLQNKQLIEKICKEVNDAYGDVIDSVLLKLK